MAVSESEVIVLPDGTWLIDGNCFTSALCENEERAKQYAKTLVNCFGCVDCINCANCNQCISCFHCRSCDYCQNCNHCSTCNYSFNVARQSGYSSPVIVPQPIPIAPQLTMQPLSQQIMQQQMLAPFTQIN